MFINIYCINLYILYIYISIDMCINIETDIYIYIHICVYILQNIFLAIYVCINQIKQKYKFVIRAWFFLSSKIGTRQGQIATRLRHMLFMLHPDYDSRSYEFKNRTSCLQDPRGCPHKHTPVPQGFITNRTRVSWRWICVSWTVDLLIGSALSNGIRPKMSLASPFQKEMLTVNHPCRLINARVLATKFATVSTEWP